MAQITKEYSSLYRFDFMLKNASCDLSTFDALFDNDVE